MLIIHEFYFVEKIFVNIIGYIGSNGLNDID